MKSAYFFKETGVKGYYMQKDHSIPGKNRTALSKSLADELRQHKRKTREHVFELYLLAAGIRRAHLTTTADRYSKEFYLWYASENLHEVFGQLPNFTKYASAGEVISIIAGSSSKIKNQLNKLPTSMNALYEIYHIAKKHPVVFPMCFQVTPRRKTLSPLIDNWNIKGSEPLINEHTTQKELKNWINLWENPTKKERKKDKYNRTVELVKISISQDIFSFDKLGKKTGKIEMADLENVIARIEEIFNNEDEEKFLLTTNMEGILKKYYKKNKHSRPKSTNYEQE